MAATSTVCGCEPPSGAEPVLYRGAVNIKPPFEMGVANFEIYLWHSFVLTLFKMIVDETGMEAIVTRECFSKANYT